MHYLLTRSGIAILAFMCVFIAPAANGTPASDAEITPGQPSFSVPLADEAPGIARAYSGSAFLVFYREKIFLVTNAHVVLAAGMTHKFYFHHDKTWVPIQTMWTFTNAIDVTAIDVTGIIPREKAGMPRLDTAELIPQKTSLTVLCNPDSVPISRIGRYNGINENGSIELKFSEKGLVAGCSGAPLVDSESRIRGIITSGSAENATKKVKWGYAIPMKAIADFLDEKFF